MSNIKRRKPWVNSLLGGQWCSSNCFYMGMGCHSGKPSYIDNLIKLSNCSSMKFLVINFFAKLPCCCAVCIRLKFFTNFSLSFFALFSSVGAAKNLLFFLSIKVARPGFDPWLLHSLKFQAEPPCRNQCKRPFHTESFGCLIKPVDAWFSLINSATTHLCCVSAYPFITPI